jgi:hypothetical protein
MQHRTSLLTKSSLSNRSRLPEANATGPYTVTKEAVPEDFSIDSGGFQLCLPVTGDVCFRIFRLKENGVLPEHLLDNLRIEPSQNVTGI